MLADELIEKIVIKAIINYLNNPQFDEAYIKANFAQEVELAKEEYKQCYNQPSNVSSMTQGARSVTFKEGSNVISNNVKALLPNPYIRLF